MDADSFPSPLLTGRRIAVIGTSGSGKTTLAAQLAQILRVPHIELDALNWQPNWIETPRDIFRARVADALCSDAWVIDGNYRKARDIIWGRADTIVWLDYPLPVIFSRLVKRTLRRVITREELWNGNRESLRGALFSRDSILLWALQTYQRQRRDFPRYFAEPAYQHLTIIHLTSPRAADRWRSQIGNQIGNQIGKQIEVSTRIPQ